MTLFAGLFLGLFGVCGAWFLGKRFPQARFLQIGYALMGTGGAFFVIWALSKVLAIGVAATALLTAGAIAGIVGSLRKELRW